jgi:signal transduction histidine kinase
MTSVESPEHVLLLRGDGSVAAVRDAPTEWLDRDIMTLPVSATDGCFCFVVTDNGPGMSSATAKWLFTRDPRTGKPIGLALLMARDIVAAHRGSIHVQSKLGEGASFVVRLPRGSP